MNKTVRIECDEQGNYSVGEEPSQEMEAAEQPMQPARSLEEALMMAKALFAQGGEGQPEQAEADFAKGFRGPSAAQEEGTPY